LGASFPEIYSTCSRQSEISKQTGMKSEPRAHELD
jgi:hypothetical protein